MKNSIKKEMIIARNTLLQSVQKDMFVTSATKCLKGQILFIIIFSINT